MASLPDDLCLIAGGYNRCILYLPLDFQLSESHCIFDEKAAE